MTRAPRPKEFVIHVMVADVLRKFARKEWMWTHIGHGEKRDPVTAAKLQRMGLNPGWSDFILIDGSGQVYFLEIKRSEKALIATSQEWFMERMQERGVACHVATSFDDAVETLGRWGVVPVKVMA